MNILIKIDRAAAWILFIGLLLYFISGFGMTKGIIDPSMATKIHTQFLTYIIIVAFVAHTGFAVHLAFRRWNIWNKYTKILLIIFYLGITAFFFWVDKFYAVKADSLAPVITGSASSTVTQKVFTVSELAKYNGQNGQPAYVAVDGDVYDLSSVFIGGWHARHFAGKDLTGEFYSRHVKNVLSKYPIIGTLAK